MPTRARASAPKSYHHGDLHHALVRSGLDLLREEGPEALTLRGVARAAGVSQAAPYRHFADRRALVAAVAEAGFRMMQAAMFHAVDGTDGRTSLKAVAFAYVRFGLKHPALYRIMFGPEVASQDDLPELRETSGAVLGFVREGIAVLQKQKLVSRGNAHAMAIATWSTLHGLVMLSLDNQAGGAGLSVDVLVEEATHMMMFGMAPRKPARTRIKRA